MTLFICDFLQDVSASLSKKYPELYKEGIRNTFFKWRVIAIWAFFAIYQSLVFYHFVTASSITGMNKAGKMFGLWDVSTMAFTCVVVTVNLRLLMMSNTITRWHHVTVGGSILAWFIFVFIYSGIVLPKDQVSSVNSHCFSVENFTCWCSWGFFYGAGKYLFRHLCVDEYDLFLPDAASCSYSRTFLWFYIPGVRSFKAFCSDFFQVALDHCLNWAEKYAKGFLTYCCLLFWPVAGFSFRIHLSYTGSLYAVSFE